MANENNNDQKVGTQDQAKTGQQSGQQQKQTGQQSNPDDKNKPDNNNAGKSADNDKDR